MVRRKRRSRNKRQESPTQPESAFEPSAHQSIVLSVVKWVIFVLGEIGEVVLLPIKMIGGFVVFIFELYNRFITQFRQTLQKNTIQLSAIRTFFYLSIQKKSREYVQKILRILKPPRHLPKSKVIFVDTHHKPVQHQQLLKKRLPHKISRVIILSNPPSILTIILWFTIGAVVTFFLAVIPLELTRVVSTLPDPHLLTARDVPVTTKIYDRNGVLLYELYADENRTPVQLAEIPAIVKNATIAIEDKDFYRHNGFSLRGTIRALRETLLNDHVQGGSTITQQLIKTALLTPEITLKRKIKELVLSFWAERIYSKDKILEMYLNQVPYGGTSWGIESASETYFGKSVSKLTLGEAALLTGLPQAPTDYSPFGSHPEKTIERQHEVLQRMREDGYITKEQEEAAKKEQLRFKSPAVPIRAPHFVLYVKEYLIKRYGERQVLQGGLRVTTTLDSTLQDKVQSIVSNTIDSLSYLKVGNGSALVTDPKNGEILSMVGSRNYFDSDHDGNVNVTLSLRQPGSSIKVVTYTAALESGKYTAATLIDDSPVSYPQIGQPAYAPVNYDGKFHGLTPLRYALGNSFNIPAVKVLNAIGVPTMIEKAKLMGISTWDDSSRFGLSLTLGGGEVTMMSMAEVYGTLANSGKRVPLTPIKEISDYTGQILEKGNPQVSTAATTPEVAWIISNILSDNQARVLEFGPNSNLVIPGKTVSAKTGTTNDKRDNWTIGYTPSWVTTVWVGNNDNSPMNQELASGITGAAPIWQQIMQFLLKDKADEVPPKPDTVTVIPCYFGRVEYFIKGTEPASNRCAAYPTLTPSPLPSP
jgi:penicillin-binding protein 1C